MENERNNLPSCSAFGRLAQCPYSFRYESIPEQTSAEAERGNRIHAWLKDGKTFLNKEEKSLAISCYMIEKEVVKRWKGETPDEQYGVLFREERCWYMKENKPIFSGQPDVVYGLTDQEGKQHLLILDYKTGAGEVASAEVNLQLRGLAVCVTDYVTQKFAVDISTVSVAIIQPLVTGDPLLITYNKEDLEAAEKESVELADGCFETCEPLAGSHCQYCKGKPQCQAISSVLAKVASTSLSSFTTDLSTKTPQERATLYRTACLAEKVAKEIKQAVTNILQAGEEVEGFGLKDGKRMRKFTDSDAILSRASQFMTQEKISKCVSVSVSQLQEQFHIHQNVMNGKQSKKTSNEQFDTIFGDLITETTTSPSVSAK